MTQFLYGNQIKLLRSGEEYFPALETAIEAAQHEIYLETYIYQADKVGVQIGQSLTRAAQRGVSVYLLLDGFGSKDLPISYLQSLSLAGVQVLFYRARISPWSLKRSRLRRLHRKVVVIDQKIGFVGGINIIDDYDVPAGATPRVDYAVRLEGALLPMLHASVAKFWRRIAWSQMRRLPMESMMPHDRQISGHQGMQAALVLRDNILHRRDIEQAYLEAITSAKNEIIIANAYFLPGRDFRKALLEASLRGVRIKLLLQGRVEYFAMFATHAFYSLFLQNKIEIFEYQKSFMHSKVAVIDDEWATVGSSNIDPFSLLLAREANVIVMDKQFSTELKADILKTIEDGSVKIAHEAWQHRSLRTRLASWCSYGLMRIFLGLIGYAKEQ